VEDAEEQSDPEYEELLERNRRMADPRKIGIVLTAVASALFFS